MKAALSAWFLIASTQALAQGMASAWFPMEVGNQWLYEHESRDTPANNPHVTTWQTVETVTGTLAIPEGTVVLRRVEVKGNPPGGWLPTVYGESNYLVRNDCLYFLTPHDSWNEQDQGLRPEYRTELLAGDVEPEFCFPLAVGDAFGKNDSHGRIPSRVVGMGRGHHFAPDSVSEKAFDVVVHLASADETHLWFEKGVGITGEWDWHNGTYEEYRVRLLRFQPASPRTATPQR
jgi:hypothetical protein